MDTSDFLDLFSRIFSRINFVFILVLMFFFNSANLSYSNIYLGIYGLKQPKHVNVGWLLLVLVCIGINWSSNAWLNTLFAGILSIEFLIYFVASVLYTKLMKDDQILELTNVFDSNVQFLLFFMIPFLFDIIYFNNQKNFLIILVAVILPFYTKKTRGLVFLILILSFTLYLFQVDYFEERETSSIVTTILYILSLLLVIDLVANR